MLTNLNKSIFLVLIFFSVTACNRSKDNQLKDSAYTQNDILLNRALLTGYYFQQNEHLGICVSNNKIYLISDEKSTFDEGFVLLHFIKNDNTFENKDFKGENNALDDTLFTKFKNLYVVHVPIESGDFEKIRIGQYVRKEDGSAQNLWVKEIDTRRIQNKITYYKNEFSKKINRNIIQENFDLSLKLGSFFQNPNSFYILYDDDFIYFITSNKAILENKIMLHFIDEKNEFVNKSFLFKDQNISNLLESPYNNYYTSRITLPDRPFVKVRIGQYNDEGNIWMQEFSPKEILNNPLLKYKNEFEK